MHLSLFLSCSDMKIRLILLHVTEGWWRKIKTKTHKQLINSLTFNELYVTVLIPLYLLIEISKSVPSNKKAYIYNPKIFNELAYRR